MSESPTHRFYSGPRVADLAAMFVARGQNLLRCEASEPSENGVGVVLKAIFCRFDVSEASYRNVGFREAGYEWVIEPQNGALEAV